MMPITSEAQRERVKLASAWDGHANMLLPTHIFVKGEDAEIVGCTSIGACIFSHTWLHTEKCRGFDMRRAMHDAETVARNVGYKGCCIVSPPGAEMFKHLPGLGYQDLGDVRLWVKFLQEKGA